MFHFEDLVGSISAGRVDSGFLCRHQVVVVVEVVEVVVVVLMVVLVVVLVVFEAVFEFARRGCLATSL